MAKKWGESGHPLEIVFFAIVILWYRKQLNTSPYVYRVESKPAPVGLLADPLSIWQAEGIDEGHEDQR